ncbi:MAG: hypothetical protein Kow0062_12490 [Acidobacteriota bacterium]|nr:MAG: DUF4332 domain-containing protein [Acidobacteriota bacterium]
MARKITEIEGIGPAKAEKLAQAGITTCEDLLEKCRSRKGREQVAAETGFSTNTLLSWANMADLMRISGIGGEFAELLHAAGVDTIKELAQRNPENLSEAMAKVNAEKKLTRTVPSATMVARWVEAAKTTEPMITH